MKINLIGMILAHCGSRHFDGLIINDDGKKLTAPDSLHFMIMEYAKVANDNKSDVVTTILDEPKS